MKRSRTLTILLAAWLTLLLAGCAAAPADVSNPEPQTLASYADPAPTAAPTGYRMIDTAEAMELMETEEGYIILDVRTQSEYSDGHIPNAICIPNETILAAEEIPELPDKDQLILVYCRSGRRSKESSEKLVELGYTNVVEFGGIINWDGDVVTD